MRMTIKIILLFICTFNLFSIDYNLDVITLPYDSLNIEDIVVTNKTILARSENTIYKSTDDGANWNIAFQSKKKLSQLYSLNPHTTFIIGESGLIYRTMDYGKTWFNESIETNVNFNKIAAKDYTNYMTMGGNKWLYYKKDQDSAWILLNFNSRVHLSTIVFVSGKYYFGGGSEISDYENSFGHYWELNMPVFSYDGLKFESYPIAQIRNSYNERVAAVNTDSLNLYNLDSNYYATVIDRTNSYITNYQLNYDDENIYSYNLKKDVIIGLLKFNDTLYVFSRKGKLELVPQKNLTNGNIQNENIDLKIDLANSISNSYSRTIYIASNNSKIYKLNIYNSISNVSNPKENKIKQFNDLIVIDDEVYINNIYNYLGQKIKISFKSKSQIILDKGIYFILYTYKNQLFTKKIMVN